MARLLWGFVAPHVPRVRPLGPGNVRNVDDVLTRLMAAAVDDRVVPQSPCRRTVLPPTTARAQVNGPRDALVPFSGFFASGLIAGGSSVKQVQLALGHASAVITLRIYAHLWPGEDDRTRSVMDSVSGALRAGCGTCEPGGGQPFLVSQKILSIWAM